MTATGYNILTYADLLKTATEEFKKRLDGKVYKNICENDFPNGKSNSALHDGHDQALVELAEHINQKKPV